MKKATIFIMILSIISKVFGFVRVDGLHFSGQLN